MPKKLPREALCVDVWEERDRLAVTLAQAPVRWNPAKNRFYAVGDCDTVIAEWWDEDARSMFEDGFFKARDLENSVIQYAEDMGIIEIAYGR